MAASPGNSTNNSVANKPKKGNLTHNKRSHVRRGAQKDDRNVKKHKRNQEYNRIMIGEDLRG